MTKGAVRILSVGVTERQGVCRDDTEHSRLQAEALRTMPAGGRKLDLRIAAPGRQWRLAKGAGSWALLSPPVIAMVMDDIVPANSGEVVLLRASYQRALQLEGESPPAVGYCVMRKPGGLLLALPQNFLRRSCRLWSFQKGANGSASTRPGA